MENTILRIMFFSLPLIVGIIAFGGMCVGMAITNIFSRDLPPEKKPGKVKLNLCCAGILLKEFVNIDLQDFGQEIIHDLTKGIPYPDNSVDYIIIYHGMEHFIEPHHLMKEMYRVLKPNGKVEIRVPHYSNNTAYEFTHQFIFSWSAFNNRFLNQDSSLSRQCGRWKLTWSRIMLAQKNTKYPVLYFIEWMVNIGNKTRGLYDKIFCKFIPAYEIWVIIEKV